jgi:hypothetical protein
MRARARWRSSEAWIHGDFAGLGRDPGLGGPSTTRKDRALQGCGPSTSTCGAHEAIGGRLRSWSSPRVASSACAIDPPGSALTGQHQGYGQDRSQFGQQDRFGQTGQGSCTGRAKGQGSSTRALLAPVTLLALAHLAEVPLLPALRAAPIVVSPPPCTRDQSRTWAIPGRSPSPPAAPSSRRAGRCSRASRRGG